MHLPRDLALSGLALGLCLLSATVPATAAGPAENRSDPPTARRAAERTLSEVSAAFEGREPGAQPSGGSRPTRDLTLLLRDLRLELPALARPERRAALGFLARPTDGGPGDNTYQGASDHDCGSGEPGAGTDYCVHWAESGADAPPNADTAPRNDIPDQVDRTRAVLGTVWERVVARGGYRAPRPDASGPNDKLDIYLADIGDELLYGYCASEPIPRDDGRDTTGFCVFDDDYATSQYPSLSPRANLQVTAAHEFFHAVQFGYDAGEDDWLMEGTATWVEDEVFDEVDDNRYYLRNSPLSSPGRPLDHGRGMGVYGTWIWWRFLSERFPESGRTGLPLVIRQVWRAADDSDPSRPGAYSVQAVRRVLARHDASLTEAFARFGEANRRPAQTYDEGSAGRYPTAPLTDSYLLSRTRRALPKQVAVLDHLSNRSYAFRPADGLTDDWRLRVEVDAPSTRRQPFAHMTVYAGDGSTRRRTVRLSERGIGARTVGFGSEIERVELTLTNAGRRYDCWAGTDYACQGRSLEDDLRTTFTASIRR